MVPIVSEFTLSNIQCFNCDAMTIRLKFEHDYLYRFPVGPGWLSELGSWITYQLIQAYHQYGVGTRPTLYICVEP